MTSAASTPSAPSKRGRRTPRVTGEDRERAILETFERLLSERPLAEISVDDLARGAGISRPTFYFYFASKEAVLLTLLDRLAEQAREGVELALLSTDPLGVLRAGLRSVLAVFGEHRAAALAASDASTTSPEVRELWSRVMESFVQEATIGIEAERARGAAPDGPPSARELAVSLNWMNERVLHAAFAGVGPALSEETLLDTLTEIWVRAIYAASRPPAG